jgi:hypothetical protein
MKRRSITGSQIGLEVVAVAGAASLAAVVCIAGVLSGAGLLILAYLKKLRNSRGCDKTSLLAANG